MPEDAADLARADRCIVEGEMGYTRQLVVIERLRAAGHDTTEAEDVLRRIAECLDGLRERRRLILHEMN